MKKKPDPKESARKLGALLLSFIIIFCFYILTLHYAFKIGYIALYIALPVVFVAFFVLNGGFSQNDPTKENLRSDWDDDKKERFINRVVENRKIAKRLVYILVPLIIVCSLDILYLTFFLE